MYNSFMDKKIIIFDLDGTLLNTLLDLVNSTNFALKSFNYPQRTISEIQNFVGNGVYKLIERAVPDDISDENIQKCIEIFKVHYKDNMYNKTSPYDGVIEMLYDLKQKGYILAVVSNKFDMAVKDLCIRYFKNMIDFAVGENEKEGIKKKPSPDTVFKVLEKYNYSSDQAVYVGDSEVDIQTAENSGIPCISVTWGFKDRKFLEENGAEYIAGKPEEIIEILERL